MSYQVLARKWRPKNFGTLVGQTHVVRALTHALDQGRLHHAWLFTGTRGVGKTTLSRILAKCLNCVGADGRGGLSSTPCGVCRPCIEIDAGRFVDYIEMDAASNRGVDEMAALLEQAVYAPANARFKVYMIDEVHMLTSHAFNAMLKTLEEPPEHVKFILATTDPQKIPVTVLSRCLQFNLKQMPVAEIAGHLEQVLGHEGVAFDAAALRLLAQAAAGSMRDALSLTDQAIAFSGGEVLAPAVRDMLGALDQAYLLRVLDALAERDGPALMDVVDEIAERSLSFGGALQALGALLHRIALLQLAAPDGEIASVDAAERDEEDRLRALAARLSPEDVQLHYQIAAHGRRDLSFAPDEATGFSMTLLRMLAFQPATASADAPVRTMPSVTERVARPAANATRARATTDRPASPSAMQPASRPVSEPASRPASTVRELDDVVQAQTDGPVASAMPEPVEREPISSSVEPALVPPVEPLSRTPPREPAMSASFAAATGPAEALPIDDWIDVVASLRLTGLARELVQQAQLIAHDHRSVTLRVPIKSLSTGIAVEKLKSALGQRFGRPVDVAIEVGAVSGSTVAAVRRDERAARQAEAEQAIDADPFVQAMVRDFGATIVPGSIKPL